MKSQPIQNVIEEHPEYFVALCVAFMRKMKTEKVVVTLEEMEAASNFGVALHSNGKDRMEVSLVENTNAQPEVYGQWFDVKPNKTRLN